MVAMETMNLEECEVELHKTFDDYNKEYFGGKLNNPAFLLETPKTKGYAGYDCHDKKMRIDPKVITAKDKKTINPEAPIKGRMRLIFDALLHEMIHKYCCEFLKVDESKYKGHGPIFEDQCNRISEIWGWDMAEFKGKKYDAFPLCFHPPEDFYMGASLEFSDEMNKQWREEPPCDNETERREIVKRIYKQL
jgi:hypothetical protein